MEFYLFAKFFKHLKTEELMRKCSEVGVDGVNAIIRDGYWVNENNLKYSLNNFVQSAKNFNLKVKYADTDFRMENIKAYKEKIKILKDCGIECFRVGHVLKKSCEPRKLLSYVQKIASETAELSAEIGIKAIIQIHGFCYPHNATAAYEIVKKLDSDYIGIKLDLGNNLQQEGFETIDYQVNLLNEFIGAVSVKSAGIYKKSGADCWERRFVPAYDGAADYKALFSELKNINYNGFAVLMPFYFENDYNLHLITATKEFVYLKQLSEQAGL